MNSDYQTYGPGLFVNFRLGRNGINSLDMLNNLSAYEINSPTDLAHTRMAAVTRAKEQNLPFSEGWNGTSTEIGFAPDWNGTSMDIGPAPTVTIPTPDTSVKKVQASTGDSTILGSSKPKKTSGGSSKKTNSTTNTAVETPIINKPVTNNYDWFNTLLPLLAAGGLGYLLAK